ncbi:MAG: PEP-CTERM sorting domain-containing protein [Thermodesulfobacteriota bacterium]
MPEPATLLLLLAALLLLELLKNSRAR